VSDALPHPYRTAEALPTGKRWGATFWARLATWSVRRERRRQRALVGRRRANVAACQRQQRTDLGFLYTPECRCGLGCSWTEAIPSTTYPGQMATRYRFHEPRALVGWLPDLIVRPLAVTAAEHHGEEKNR
jgi:hypothetical protein